MVTPTVTDIVLIVVLAVYALRGWHRGLLFVTADLLAFLGGVVIALAVYPEVAVRLGAWTGLTAPAARLVSFFVLVLVASALLGAILLLGVRRVPEAIRRSAPNRAGGAALGGVLAAVYVGAFLLLLIAWPELGELKTQLARSRVATEVQSLTQRAVDALLTGRGQGLWRLNDDVARLLAPRTAPEETVQLSFRAPNARPDAAAEQRMLALVNRERAAQGAELLVMDESLREVARAHSADMLRRGYFSHTSADGRTLADRLRAGGVRYAAAGENLAFAPTVAIAHRGLMRSPGHRRNILNPSFRRVGIGAMDGGPHGVMFTQAFAN